MLFHFIHCYIPMHTTTRYTTEKDECIKVPISVSPIGSPTHVSKSVLFFFSYTGLSIKTSTGTRVFFAEIMHSLVGRDLRSHKVQLPTQYQHPPKPAFISLFLNDFSNRKVFHSILKSADNQNEQSEQGN